MASRDLHDLHPALYPIAVKFVKIAKEEYDIDVLIYCTYRSDEEQAKEYAKGRTELGKIVTYAKPGQSKHNHRLHDIPASLAFDCVPLRNGKAMWSDKASYIELGEIGRSLGLEWAGDWKRFKEMPHFQLASL